MRKNRCLTYWSHSFHYIWAASRPNPTKWHVRPAKTRINLGIRPVWSESSLPTWRKLRSLAIIRAHSKAADQTGRMPRLIWVFAGAKVILLVLSWGGSLYLVSLASTILMSVISRRFISWNSRESEGFYVSMHVYACLRLLCHPADE